MTLPPPHRPAASSRRRFLALCGLVLGGVSTGLVGWWRRKGHGVAALATRSDGDAPGPLAPGELPVLGLVCETLITVPFEPARYLDFFAWRAEHLSGYRALYRRLIDDLNQHSRALAGRAFAECDAATRKEVVARIFADDPAHPPPGFSYDPPLDWDWQACLARPNPDAKLRAYQYHCFVRSEIFATFASTDGWVALGYGSAIGVPRGLEAYQHAPPGRR